MGWESLARLLRIIAGAVNLKSQLSGHNHTLDTLTVNKYPPSDSFQRVIFLWFEYIKPLTSSFVGNRMPQFICRWHIREQEQR